MVLWVVRMVLWGGVDGRDDKSAGEWDGRWTWIWSMDMMDVEGVCGRA